MSLRRFAPEQGRKPSDRVSEDRDLRRQMTDELAALHAGARTETEHSVFPFSPGAKRRKTICLLFSVFCPLSSVL
ncbi:MAG: hypothetical protein LBD06_02695 [Candidatus Accumulibacter sp.]|nr:hypothetical protein [Accumulibacter sp.]